MYARETAPIATISISRDSTHDPIFGKDMA